VSTFSVQNNTKLTDTDKPVNSQIRHSGILSIFNPTALFTLLFSSVLVVAYIYREEYLWTPEYGLGYWFGILGGVFMLLLLLYPLRKKSRKLSFFLGVKQWFRLHMLLGVAGPTLILLHCNFNLGSTNSSIALGAMLLMVSSGLIGRFIYSKIHRGLYGSRIEQQEIYLQKNKLLEQIRDSEGLESNTHTINDVIALINKYENAVIQPRSVLGNFLRTTVFSLTTRKVAIDIRLRVKEILNRENSSISGFATEPDAIREKVEHFLTLVNTYLRCVRRTAELGFYEKLFSLWHMLHMPIFGLLIFTAFFHVYAVHSY